MRCSWCDREPSGACKRCGRFYCREHGGETSAGPFCGEHWQEYQEGLGCAAFVLFATGCVLLALSAQAAEIFWVPLMFGVPTLLAAGAAVAQARWGGW